MPAAVTLAISVLGGQRPAEGGGGRLEADGSLETQLRTGFTQLPGRVNSRAHTRKAERSIADYKNDVGRGYRP